MLRISVLLSAVVVVVLAGAMILTGPAGAAQEASPVASTPCPVTSEEENEALVLRFHVEAWERGNVGIIDEVWAPWGIYERAVGEGTRGPEQLKARILEFRTGFPDLREERAFIVSEGEPVVVKSTLRGTHLGEFDGAAPTGRVATQTRLSWYRIVCGRIVEGGAEADTIGLRLDVGILTEEELASSLEPPSEARPVP
jgi:predicted ester cyclase